MQDIADTHVSSLRTELSGEREAIQQVEFMNWIAAVASSLAKTA